MARRADVRPLAGNSGRYGQPTSRSAAIAPQPGKPAQRSTERGTLDMQRNKLRRAVSSALVTGVAAGLGACGGGGSSAVSSTPPASAPATMAVVMSDASADDWACVGVRVLSIA